ncbi:MAG TPA: type I-U CRISPR-associated RAMP protein Csb1/Cas7u [Phycisphaerae bacterium]|nr:type I-U CRISPR-associated RAMP protein Csb1/Cas7u [Phycisphaerae bacterium]
MVDLLTTYDDFLKDDGPAAIVIRQTLMPVEGPDSVIFPPTYAAPKGDKDGKPRYNRDPDGPAELNRWLCAIDSVGSQANRIEPLFKDDRFKHLVPQITITHEGGPTHLLDASHRIADAIVRFSELLPEIHNAFVSYENGDPEPMARLAPTSLVFGAWDSRGTQVKIPRLVSFRIDACGAQILTRSAQYNPATDYAANGLIDEVDENTGSDLGFAAAPATGQLGGVRVFGKILRQGSLNLATLQALGSDSTPSNLQRYILGLALVSLTALENSAFTLRQGCQLVMSPGSPTEMHTVAASGDISDFPITAKYALEFATEAARKFVVSKDRTVAFDSVLANRIRKLWSNKTAQEKLKEVAKSRPLTLAELDAFERSSKAGKGKRASKNENTPAED